MSCILHRFNTPACPPARPPARTPARPPARPPARTPARPHACTHQFPNESELGELEHGPAWRRIPHELGDRRHEAISTLDIVLQLQVETAESARVQEQERIVGHLRQTR